MVQKKKKICTEWWGVTNHDEHFTFNPFLECQVQSFVWVKLHAGFCFKPQIPHGMWARLEWSGYKRGQSYTQSFIVKLVRVLKTAHLPLTGTAGEKMDVFVILTFRNKRLQVPSPRRLSHRLNYIVTNSSGRNVWKTFFFHFCYFFLQFFFPLKISIREL